MAKSIITKIDDFCYICGRRATETHHIFGGANRSLSEKYGLKIPLCHNCHNEPPHGVHFDAELMQQMHVVGQIAFERKHPDLDFREVFGKNYKED